jgi:DNA-binding SARP family transcriptional activator/tetratricopeptide (TPR) repeat protein
MPHAARLRLFGVPALLNGDGSPVKLRTTKQLGALVYLALEGRDQAVSRDRLVDLLWEGVSPERGRHSMAQACSAMRAALGRGALERQGEAFRLAAPVVTDLDRMADEFDRLPLAEPLAEAEWWAGAEFGHWVDGARARLKRAAEEALRRAVGDFRRTGETARVHAAAAVLYRLDPLSATAVHALAERELIAGDVVGAIRLLRAHLARVQEALGCSPHREVERLLRRLEAGSHPPIERVPARLAAEAPALRPSVFVGREKELAHLGAEWQRAAEGAFRSCLVLGPGGIGKSSLVRRFAATAAARAQPIFVVTCQEIGEGIPFAALSDLIAALSRDPSVSATDPKWLAEVARIHPALRTQYPGIPDPPDAPPESIRLRVAEGLLQMLDAVADAGSVGIVFDDLPFMDPATRDVLHVLARRLGDRPVLLIATARTPELLEASTPAFPGMSIVTWSTQERLAPLDGESTRQLASELSPAVASFTRVLERIEHISEGNPHFTEMLVVDWERHAASSLAGRQSSDALPGGWQPPDSLRQAFAKTYAGLSGLAQEILHILAVAGRALRIEERPTSLLFQQPDMNGAILELLRRGILRLDDGFLSFKNELHRAFVYYAISGDLRRLVHANLGKALLANDGYVSKLEAGRHLGQAGLHGDATAAVLEGARLAVENGAAAEAESAIRLVLGGNHQPRILSQLTVLLAEALSAQGHYAESLDLLEAADLESLSDHNTHALVAYLRAQALQRVRITDDRTIVVAAERAMELAAVSSSESLQAAAAQVVAEAASEIEIPEMLRRAVDTTSRLAHESRSHATRAQALLTTGFCLFLSGRFEEALSVLHRSGAMLRASCLEADMTRALNGAGLCLLGLARHKEAITPLAAALRGAIKLNDSAHKATLLNNLGVAYEEVGSFDEAQECYLEAASSNPSDHYFRGAVNIYVNATHIALVRGDLDAAQRALGMARDAAKRSQSWRLGTIVDFSEADLILTLGEPERAWPVVARAASLTWGRERSLDTNGREIRLTLHYTLVTAGPARFESLVRELTQKRRPLRAAHTLEIAGFLEWAARQGYVDSEVAKIGDVRVTEESLPGPIAALAAVGTPPRPEWERRPGESAVQMIDRAMPNGRRTHSLPPVREILLNLK